VKLGTPGDSNTRCAEFEATVSAVGPPARTRGVIRTRTVESLGLSPLPLGDTGFWCATGDLNSDLMRSERIASAVGLVARGVLHRLRSAFPPAKESPAE
jgi:hypothetical protein